MTAISGFSEPIEQLTIRRPELIVTQQSYLSTTPWGRSRLSDCLAPGDELQRIRTLATVSLSFGGCSITATMILVVGPLSQAKPLPTLRVLVQGVQGNTGNLYDLPESLVGMSQSPK